MMNEFQRRILAEAAKFGGKNITTAEKIVNKLNEAPAIAPSAVTGMFGYSKQQFEMKMRQLIQKMGFEKGINKMEVGDKKMILHFANAAKARDFIITFNGLTKRQSKGSPATISTSFDNAKAPAGTNAIVTVDFSMLKTEGLDNESHMFVVLESLHEQYIAEGGVKAAIEDFMYDMLPKQAIAELKPIMKNQSIRGADLRNKVTTVLKKHKVPLMHIGGSSAQLVIDYFDTFHGESVEEHDEQLTEAQQVIGKYRFTSFTEGSIKGWKISVQGMGEVGFVEEPAKKNTKTSVAPHKVFFYKSFTGAGSPSLMAYFYPGTETRVPNEKEVRFAPRQLLKAVSMWMDKYGYEKIEHAKKEEVEVSEQFKAGDKVKVPHKGKMVSGKIVRFDSGGTDKARQHGGGYVVDVGEPASVLVPKQKVQKEEVERIAEVMNPQEKAKQDAINARIRKLNTDIAVDQIKEILRSYTHDKKQREMIIAAIKQIKEEVEVTEAKVKYLTGPGKKDSKRIIGIYTMGGKWVKDMKTEREAAAFVNKSWGESVEEDEELVTEIQTPERAKEMKKMLDAAYKKQQADLKKAFKAGANEGDPIINKIDREKHKLDRLDDYEKNAKTKLFGKGGKIVKEEVELDEAGWGESVEEDVEEAYAPLDTPNLIGAFTETTKKKRFEYRKSTDKWGISHGLPHEVCVKVGGSSQGSRSDWRAANVKGTVCYIATDEGEGGKPVIEKWAIRNHVKYVKAEETEQESEAINELRMPTQAEFDQVAKDIAAKKLKRAATKQAVTQAGMKVITAVGSRTLLRTSIKMLGKETTRFLLKKIPFVGLALGAVFAANRLAKGEYVKAAVELVGGVASTFPGFGTAVAITCDAALVTGDVQKIFAMKKDFEEVKAGRMTEDDFKKKYNLEKLKNESVETERWAEIDSAVTQLINEYNDIDSAVEDVITEMVEDGEEIQVNEAAPEIKAGMRLYAKQDKKTDNGSVVKGQYYKVVDAGNGLFDLIHQSTGYRKAMHKVTASAIQAMIQNKGF